MKHRILSLFVRAVFLVVALFLPVIPVQTSPVIPNPSYRLNFVSLYTIFEPFTVGMRHRTYWYSFLAAVALLILAYVLGAWISKMFASRLREEN